MKKSILLIISSFLLLSLTSNGQSLDSLNYYRKQAERGDSLAQYNLAELHFLAENFMLDQGDTSGVVTNNLEKVLNNAVTNHAEKAFYWFQKSAEKGFTKAQYMLALVYYKGEGTSKDLSKAFYWYKKSAGQGFSWAQNNLAFMYYNGIGTSKDLNKAFYWRQKSAEQGYAPAQFSLASMYYFGQGTTKDFNKAIYWRQKSAEQGVAEAQYALGLTYSLGEGTTKDFRKAFNWYKKSAEQGNPKAQFSLASMYYFGQGTMKDFNKAFFWFQKSAEQGVAEAQYALGLTYSLGEGTTKDFRKAFNWYKKSAEQGNPKAQYNLALMYFNGKGTSKDLNKAFYWRQKSAEQGNPKAQYNLALMYYNGEGTSKDSNKSFFWFQKSAEQGYEKAQYNIAILYYYGQGTSINKKQAAYWMRKSYNKGYQKAKEEWNKLELWKYEAKAKSVNNKVCSSIKSYGDINICLPIVSGMTECYSNPKIRTIINHLYSSESQTFMGVYINSVDYKKYKNLNDYRLFDEDIYVFAPNALKNKPVNYDYLKELDSQMGNFLKLKWKELKPKIEKHDNYVFKVGKPILLERYNINSYCFSKLFLAQGKLWDRPIIVVKVLNLIDIKHKLIIVLYNLRFNGEASIKEAKARNEKFVLKLINANK